MIQRLSKDQQGLLLEARKRPIQEITQPKNEDLCGTCFQVTSLECAASKQISSWTEKTRTPTEGFFIFRVLINTKVAFTVSSLINLMKSGFWGTAFVNRDD